jgi:predicted DNA-binding transcriptional regulator YafY
VKKKSRLFALADYLRGRRTGVTAEQLAERFGVTVRTIYRDLDALRDASVPLQAERGPGGGYALDRSYSLPPINLTAREAALLVVLGRFATETRLVPFTDTLASALDKVRGALTGPSQRELLAHAESLAFAAIPQAPVKREVRRAVEEAWFEKKAIFVRYRRSTGEIGERTVRIKAVLMERTMTLLACEDIASGGENRSIRLDRIEIATVLREQGQEPSQS